MMERMMETVSSHLLHLTSARLVMAKAKRARRKKASPMMKSSFQILRQDFDQ